MPKKTTHPRSGGQAQRSKAKPKSFELVRPDSDESELETAEENEKISVANVKTSEIVEDDDDTYNDDDEEEEEKVPVKQLAQAKKVASVGKSASVATVAPVVASSNPKSAAARLAARRLAAQKSQRPAASLIVAENYSYVRKDLVFILILAVVMFTAIIVMHFVPAIGG